VSDGGFALLWGDPPRPTRGPKPAMSVGRIVAAGIAVADAEGLAAVSMQRVASDLGFTKMSLYRYVPGKAELVAAMADTAIGPAPTLDGSGGWRLCLQTWAITLFGAFRDHFWLLDATVGPRVIGPRELAWMEAAVACLDGTALAGARRLDAVATVTGHVRMIAQQAASAVSESDLGAGLAAVLRTRAAEFPAVTAAFMDPDGRDDALTFGLELILDGIARKL
jgi:AcrR family transcriptional regulator